MSDERHVMAGLPGVGWTCTCGDIHASSDQRDVFIHIEWALRAERDEARAEVKRLRAALVDTTGFLAEWRSLYHRAEGRASGLDGSTCEVLAEARAALSPSPPDTEEQT